MITPKEAEALATKHIQDYVAACQVGDLNDLGNVLLKMLSVTGQAILATQGQKTAVAMLEGTAAHLAKPQFSKPYTMTVVQ